VIAFRHDAQIELAADLLISSIPIDSCRQLVLYHLFERLKQSSLIIDQIAAACGHQRAPIDRTIDEIRLPQRSFLPHRHASRANLQGPPAVLAPSLTDWLDMTMMRDKIEKPDSPLP